MADYIAVNEKGYAIGEDHHASKLSNREVDLLRQLRRDDPKYWTFVRLAEKFDISKKHAWRLFHYIKRNQIAYDFRKAGSGLSTAPKAVAEVQSDPQPAMRAVRASMRGDWQPRFYG